MKIFKLLVISLLVFLFACEATDLDKGKIIGRVKNHSTGDLIEDVKVYLRQKQDGVFTLYDTLYTSSVGYFKFYDVESGTYDIHAAKFSDELEENVSHVTPFIDEFEFDDQVISPSVGDIEAYTINSINASISGTVYYEDGSPANEASIEIRLLQAEEEFIFNIVYSDANGDFSSADFITGNYYLIVNSFGVVPAVSTVTDIFFHDGNGEEEIGEIYLN
jgi:hypothetical protein